MSKDMGISMSKIEEILRTRINVVDILRKFDVEEYKTAAEYLELARKLDLAGYPRYASMVRDISRQEEEHSKIFVKILEGIGK